MFYVSINPKCFLYPASPFCVSHSIVITSENNLSLQLEEMVLDNTEQCQKKTHFIKILLDDIVNIALRNLEKSSDSTKMTCHTN